jgi:NAD(P)-dependent dehydrogenase (short-subunit alcohol dehydrogenase family)
MTLSTSSDSNADVKIPHGGRPLPESEALSDYAIRCSATMSFADFEQEFFEKVRPSSLIKRFARPEKVASLVAYVARPLASATTGAALRVDGGVIKSAF